MCDDHDRLIDYFKLALRTDEKCNVFNCRVCEEVFTVDGEKVPRLLQCGHTVCHSCLVHLRSCLSSLCLRCPFDRQLTELTENGVQDLKKNFVLIELLELLEQSKCKESTVPPKESPQPNQPCDEDETHTAVLYCTVCGTHLCQTCDTAVHSSKTLAKHRRVPLTDKPNERPRCPIHPTHVVEFTCTQTGCENILMCYLCKNYGRHSTHQAVLVEVEADNIRRLVVAAMQKMTQFMESMRDTSHRIEKVTRELQGWAVEDAMQRVHKHFDKLRAVLAEQEKVAKTRVDIVTRNRLYVVRVLQAELAEMRPQVAQVCLECENILSSEDCKLLKSAEKFREMLSTVEKHQRNYARLGQNAFALESSIPLIFSRNNTVHIGTKIDMRVVILGLDGAGKTSILSAMKEITLVGAPMPTIGFNVESLEYKNIVFTFWDFGGQEKFRPSWRRYYYNTQAVIFVIDASNRSRFDEAQNELSKIVSDRNLKEAFFLIYANKQDIDGCATVGELTEIMSLPTLCCRRVWHIEGSSSTVSIRSGYMEGLDWLSQQLGAQETE